MHQRIARWSDRLHGKGERLCRADQILIGRRRGDVATRLLAASQERAGDADKGEQASGS